MSIEITVPALPESVADASLLDWHKQVGEHIRRDELLVEVETDKVVLEVVAPEDGVVAEILQPTGATVMGGDVLARIEPGAAESAPEKPAASEPKPESKPESKPKPEPKKPAAPASTPSAAQPADEIAMSPAVRRLVEEHGLNPTEITGSGRDGRVTKEDILAFIGTSVAPDEAPRADAQPASTPHKSAPKKTHDGARAGSRQEQREPMSRLRRTIANRLVQAQHTTALLTTFNEVNMQPVMDLRTRYKDEFEQKHGTRLGFMSFFVKASVTALQKFPLVNAYIDGDDIVRHNYYDIGIAVASPRGLLVPIVRNCEGLGFAEIEIQIREYGSRAQDGKIGLDDLSGGTFTITNGGTFGSLLSTPILNPPQSAILGMHKIEPRPIAEDGQVVIRPMMYLALSYDHRIIDGKEAVQFVVTIKELLEDPASMLFQL